MRHMKFNESEVLEEFYTKAMDAGMLDRPAENVYPDFDISAPVVNELEGIVAIASHDNNLYGLAGESGEEMVGKAHPGGGTIIGLDNNKPADKNMARVETIVERQKVMRDVAEGKPTGKVVKAMAKLISLANLLDERGDLVAAAAIDSALVRIAAEADAEEAEFNTYSMHVHQIEDTVFPVIKNLSALFERRSKLQNNVNTEWAEVLKLEKMWGQYLSNSMFDRYTQEHIRSIEQLRMQVSDMLSDDMLYGKWMSFNEPDMDRALVEEDFKHYLSLLEQLDNHFAALNQIVNDLILKRRSQPSPQPGQNTDKKERIKTMNTQVINLLNDLRQARGQGPLSAKPEAGVITKEVDEALAEVKPYSTQTELVNKIRALISSAKTGGATTQPAPGASKATMQP